MNFETIWKNIQLHEGETFHTKRGIAFSYRVYKDYILINDDKRRRATKNAIKASLAIVNPSPSKIQKAGIWAPAYIWGIITDQRIRA